jgi:hypothetical protein
VQCACQITDLARSTFSDHVPLFQTFIKFSMWL